MRSIFSVSHSLILASTSGMLLLLSTATVFANEPLNFRLTNLSEDSSLNIRQQPSLAAKSIGRIPAKSNLDISNLGCLSSLNSDEYSWCEVKWNGIQGWASSDYLIDASLHSISALAAAEQDITITAPAPLTKTTLASRLTKTDILSLPDATILKSSRSASSIEQALQPVLKLKMLPPTGAERNTTGEYEKRLLNNKPLSPEEAEHAELENLRHPLPPFMGQPFYEHAQ